MPSPLGETAIAQWAIERDSVRREGYDDPKRCVNRQTDWAGIINNLKIINTPQSNKSTSFFSKYFVT